MVTRILAISNDRLFLLAEQKKARALAEQKKARALAERGLSM